MTCSSSGICSTGFTSNPLRSASRLGPVKRPGNALQRFWFPTSKGSTKAEFRGPLPDLQKQLYNPPFCSYNPGVLISFQSNSVEFLLCRKMVMESQRNGGG